MPLQPRFAVNYKTIKFPQPQTNEIHLRVQIFSVVSHKVNIQILALLLELKKITTASPFLLLLPSWMDPSTHAMIVFSTLQQLHTDPSVIPPFIKLMLIIQIRDRHRNRHFWVFRLTFVKEVFPSRFSVARTITLPWASPNSGHLPKMLLVAYKCS